MFGHAAEFSDGVGATWSLSTTSGNCVLAQEVGDYGEARFMGVKGQPLRFEVLGHRDLFAPGPVDLLRVAPPWHRDFPNTDVVAQIPHRSGGAVRTADQPEVLLEHAAGRSGDQLVHPGAASFVLAREEVGVE